MASANTLKRKRPDYSEETIIILVGPQDQRFNIHPSVLTQGSKYFRASLSPYWREGRARGVYLRDVEPKIFSVYSGYAYTGDIDLTTDGSGKELNETTDPEGMNRFHLLAKLYIHADRIQDLGLRNSVMDKILDLERETSSRPGDKTITLAYENTLPNSKLRQYVTDTFLAGTNPGCFRGKLSQFPQELLEDLVEGWGPANCDKKTVFDKPIFSAKCTYHEHDDEVDQGDGCFENAYGGKRKMKASPTKGGK